MAPRPDQKFYKKEGQGKKLGIVSNRFEDEKRFVFSRGRRIVLVRYPKKGKERLE